MQRLNYSHRKFLLLLFPLLLINTRLRQFAQEPTAGMYNGKVKKIREKKRFLLIHQQDVHRLVRRGRKKERENRKV